MKQRQVSIELLRIVAMFMVLVLHANFMGIGVPTAETVLTSDGIIRSMLQSLSMCAVDTFVMISGWFGIRPSVRGFVNFMWQVFFFVSLSCLVPHFVVDMPISFKDVLRCFGLYGGGGWFVASYIGLYILSPVLNAFLDTARPRVIAMLLAAFFIFELLWGNSLSVSFIVGGYSTFSFIGIYLLAGMLRRLNIKTNIKVTGLLFVGCVTVNGILYIASVYSGAVAVTPALFNYINPLVIASAATLLLTFANMQDIGSKRIGRIILWLSSSCFAAYLLHVGSSFTSSLYYDSIRSICSGLSWAEGLLLVLLFIVGVFLMAVLLDQPRKLMWNYLIKPILKNK